MTDEALLNRASNLLTKLQAVQTAELHERNGHIANLRNCLDLIERHGHNSVGQRDLPHAIDMAYAFLVHLAVERHQDTIRDKLK